LDERKQDKLQWLQDPSEINGDNLNNIRHEASRHFGNKERECLKDKINQAGSGTLPSENHKLINSVWNEEELHDQWKESIIVPVHKKGEKMYCSNCRGISLLSTS
jgi:hypothetical protein